MGLSRKAGLGLYLVGKEGWFRPLSRKAGLGLY
jgi:hypothetical protein